MSSTEFDPFGFMHNETVGLLSAKAADYGLSSSTSGANLQSDKESEDFEEVLDSDLDANLLCSYLSDLYTTEKENISNGITEESAEIGLLHTFKKSIDLLKERYDKCIELVNELRSNYEMVTERTSSLHNACDRMMAHQTQIAAGAEQIRANLYYYTQYESVMKKLNTGKFSITGQVFTQILSTIDECLRFLNNHIHYKDSDTYITKYKQCLSRAMTVIRMGVMADLEASNSAVKDRHMKLDVDNGQSGYSDDETFALLYGVFAARASSIRSTLNVAEQHFRDVAEFQLMAADCQQAYFKIRYEMLEPVIRSTIDELKRTHENSSCALTRNGCAFLLRLCDDEFRLYKQFFTVGGDDGSGSRSVAVSTPSGPHASILAPLISGTTSFDDFIESLCRVFYDTLRPIIIHNPHLETLTELCTILKVEMIEERCGLMQSVMSVKRLTGYTNTGTSSPSCADEYMMNPRNGFVRVMTELVGDVAERIVYRTGLYAQSDIAGFIPSSGDLVYPEKLEMMREIEKEHTSDKDNINATSSTSAVNLYCLWYPTVRRTVLSLSKLFKCLEPSVFQSIARELLTACCQSLEDAAEQIRNSATEKISRTRRSLDAELFIVKHLLILREQTSPYRVIVPPGSASCDTIPQRDYVFDFSKYKTSASQLFHDRHRWFQLTSNNAFLEFLLQVPLAVTEAAGDSRRIIDVRLKTHCHNLINTASDVIIFEFADYIAKAEETAAMSDFDLAKNDSLNANSMQNFAGQAYRKLTHLWPEIKGCFDLYIGFKETENILLQPVKKRIIDVFTRAAVFVDKFYDDEQKQIAGLPTQEHIWLIMNA
ncbi:Sec34-like family protein [Acanthocheilonema viteae]